MGDRVRGKIAVVTGAGSVGPGVGNGKAAAILYAREGAKVFLVDYNLKAAEETKRLIDKEGGISSCSQADVSKSADCERIINECINSYGRIDILHNNVGIEIPGGIEDISEADWDRTLDVNLKSVFLTCKHALPHMAEQGNGAIVNISSICGIIGSFANAAYHASKGAVRIFSKAAAIQYAPDKIRVNSIHPGFVDTPMTQPGHANPEIAQIRMDATPLGRFGTPRDIAMGCTYLASDEAAWITGSELVIDGGMTAN